MKFRLVLVAAVMLAGSHAMAQRVCKNYDVAVGGATGTGADPTSACASVIGKVIQVGRPVATVVGSTPNPENPEGACDVSYTSTGTPGATFWTVGTMIGRVVDCDNECKAFKDQRQVMNYTVGYSRTLDGEKLAAAGTPPSAVACQSGCEIVHGDVMSRWYSDSVTSTGLYRISQDVDGKYSGEACDKQPPKEANPEEPVPACPGYVGEVNGKPICVPRDLGGDTTTPPSKVPPSTGNPKAGPKGEGSMPPTGDGGPGGGPNKPSTGGTTGGGTGTVTKPTEGQEQANCGAPGQPKCAINEDGTPNSASAKAIFDGPGQAVDQVKTDAGKAFDDIKQLKAEPWTFTFQLPTGCTDLSFDWGAFGGIITVDVCKHQALIHSLMSFLWICAGIGGSFILLQRTVSG